MGQSASFTTYEAQLFEQKEPRSYEVPNSAEKGTTPIYRNLTAKEGFKGFLKTKEEKEDVELDTAWKLFTVAVKNYGDRDFIGHRPYTDPKDPSKRGEYKFIKYKYFYDNYILPWGNGLQALGLAEKSNIGIFSMNRPEWYAVHMGNLSQSFRTAALYDTLGPQAVAYITSHAECPLVVCEKSKLKKLYEAIRDSQKIAADESHEKYETYKGFQLKFIVQLDSDDLYGNVHETVDDADRNEAKELGMELLSFHEVLEKGKDKTDVVEPTKDDLAYIMYTSGTTGDPKGVMLQHKAFAAMVSSGQAAFKVSAVDVYISYLPLAHIFEAAGQALMTAHGAKVCYYQGDIRKILDDWKSIRPTVLVGVPRVYAKTYDRFQAQTANLTGVKGMLISNAKESSQKAVRQGRRSKFYDTLVWNKVPEKFGFDRVRVLVSGAAPLPPHVAEFLRIALPNAEVMQGYGMTETCAGGCTTDPDDICLGHIGSPVDNIEIRLVDAPECNYLTTDKPYPRGEVQMRGLSVMAGYFKNEAATKKTISEDGWLSTGDIGRINPNKTISIIDRRKNLFKLANGEYIASEKVESQYTKVAAISQCFVYGHSNKNFIVGIVVPDAAHVVEWFEQNGWWTAQDKQLTPATEPYAQRVTELMKEHNKSPDDEKDEGKQYQLKKFIAKEIEVWKKDSGLSKAEQMKDFHVETEINGLLQGFSIDNNCLTPTFKKKRPQLTRRYIDQIKQLYTVNGDPPKDTETWIK